MNKEANKFIKHVIEGSSQESAKERKENNNEYDEMIRKNMQKKNWKKKRFYE